MKARAVVESNRLEFAVPGHAAALENEEPLAGAAEPGHNDWFISRRTLQVPHSQRQMCGKAAVGLEAPTPAESVAQRAFDYVHELARSINDGQSIIGITRDYAFRKMRVRREISCSIVEQFVVVAQLLEFEVSG